jgi:hypothetical protein
MIMDVMVQEMPFLSTTRIYNFLILHQYLGPISWSRWIWSLDVDYRFVYYVLRVYYTHDASWNSFQSLLTLGTYEILKSLVSHNPYASCSSWIASRTKNNLESLVHAILMHHVIFYQLHFVFNLFFQNKEKNKFNIGLQECVEMLSWVY